MKKYILLFLVVLLAFPLISQDTKLVTKKYSDSKQISESYYVLKSDNKVKHGDYVSYFELTNDENDLLKRGVVTLDNFIKIKGKYTNGKKDGEWIEYSFPMQVKCQGNFERDKKIGIWMTTREKGIVIERFDFDNNKKLEPIINITPSYPKSAVESGIEGVVIISFQKHSDCSISNIEISNSLSADCDKAAIETINRFAYLFKKYGVDCIEKTEVQVLNFVLKR